jgi:hypothetical protein
MESEFRFRWGSQKFKPKIGIPNLGSRISSSEVILMNDNLFAVILVGQIILELLISSLAWLGIDVIVGLQVANKVHHPSAKQ